MNIERLNRGEAEKAMCDWIENFPQLPVVSGEYIALRNDLEKLFQNVLNTSEKKSMKIRDYYTDAQFGFSLYMYLKNQNWFTLRLAADDGFWRYLSLKVIPDVVTKRWGKDNESHFWSTPGDGFPCCYHGNQTTVICYIT